MGALKRIDKQEYINQIEKDLDNARNLLIELCNRSYLPSIEYEHFLFYHDSIDFLLERLNGFLRNQKIENNETKA